MQCQNFLGAFNYSSQNEIIDNCKRAASEIKSKGFQQILSTCWNRLAFEEALFQYKKKLNEELRPNI